MVRIIPCLDLRDGEVVKGVNFQNIREIGSISDLSKKYDEDADEIIFLNISFSKDKKETYKELMNEIKDLKTFKTVGGGIQSVEDCDILFSLGADRVSIASAALKDPDFLKEVVEKYGPEKILVALDTEYDPEKEEYILLTDGGKVREEKTLLEFLKELEELKIPEILLTSKDCDGEKKGYDLKLYKYLKDITPIKIIASGGAGKIEDFVKASELENISGLLAASVFHFDEIQIEEIKNEL